MSWSLEMAKLSPNLRHLSSSLQTCATPTYSLLPLATPKPSHQPPVGLLSYQKLLDDYISFTLLVLEALLVVHLFIVMYPHQYLEYHTAQDISVSSWRSISAGCNGAKYRHCSYLLPGVKSEEGNQWRVKQIEYEC